MGRPRPVAASIVLSVALRALLVPQTLAQTGRSSPARALALGDSLRAAFETDAAIQAYRRGLGADPRHPTLLQKAALELDAALAIEPKDRLDKLEQNRQARRLRAGLY